MSGYSRKSKKIQMRVRLFVVFFCLLVFFSSQLDITVRDGTTIIHSHRKRAFFCFVFFYTVSRAALCGQIEMNWQLNCLLPCNLSRFVSYFLLISPANSLIPLNSPFFPPFLALKIHHSNFTTTKISFKKPVFNPRGLKPTPRRRTKDSRIIITLKYPSFFQTPPCPRGSYYGPL